MSMQRVDALTRPEPPDRLYYATGVLLDAEDFNAEQTYHRSRLARALAYTHGWGTVAGLEAEWVAAEATEDRQQRLKVNPGMAFDRLGRIVEVPRAVCLRLSRWFDGQDADKLTQGVHTVHVTDEHGNEDVTGVVVDVFIRYWICERGKRPAFASGPFDALDAVCPSRLRDSFKLEPVIRAEDPPPVPEDPWSDLLPEAGEGPAEPNSLTKLQKAIFRAWRESTEQTGLNGLELLAEHAHGQDPTSLFLARVVIPTTGNLADDGRPERDGATKVRVMNHLRPFVYTTAGLMSAGLIGTP